MAKSNRTLLRGPRPGEKASPIQAWMADHPAAVKFVADWLAARAVTPWNNSDLTQRTRSASLGAAR